jgi:ribosome biogenesis protein ERB1
LTDAQLELIDRIRSGKYASKAIANADYSVEYSYTDPFPIHAHPPAKRNFMPSKWETLKINKILDGILSGRIKPASEKEEQQEEPLFDVWKAKLENVLVGAAAVSAPRISLPTHHESYNPPEEYLYDKKELEEWKEMDELDRPTNFIPQKFDKIRHVPFYDKLINERFDRCLDLYLCPRVKKKKLNMNPEELIPKIPSVDELKPFPTALNIVYTGHAAAITSLVVSPKGQFLASGDKTGVFIVW